MVQKKKGGKPVGIAHNPQVGTIVVMDNGDAMVLRTGEGAAGEKHAALGWSALPGFDVVVDEEQPVE